MSEESSEFTYSQKALDVDAYAEDDAATEWPEGSSIMPFSEDADWDSSGTAGFAVTDRAGDIVHQEYYLPGSSGNGYRDWDTEAEPAEWAGWQYPVSASHTHTFLSWRGSGGITEASPITSYPPAALTYMTKHSEDNWNSLGHSIDILTFYASDGAVGGGHQEITDRANGGQYKRYWDGAAWSSWVEVSGA